MAKTILQRFTEKYIVDPSGCWNWTASCFRDGYGQLSVGGRAGRPRGAHRVSWELYRGPIPDGLCVLHHCDNPRCVNVDHLFLGTKADNHADMRKKGRDIIPPLLKGERNENSKLTDSQVLEIRDATESQRQIASRYGLSQPHVARIKARKSWAHL